MLQLGKMLRLYATSPLTSRDHRYVLHYDRGGVATLIDTASGEIRWRAGAAGTLQLVSDGVLRVFDPQTSLFAAYNRDGTTKTFFRCRGQDYFDRQPGQPVKPSDLR